LTTIRQPHDIKPIINAQDEFFELVLYHAELSSFLFVHTMPALFILNHPFCPRQIPDFDKTPEHGHQSSIGSIMTARTSTTKYKDIQFHGKIGSLAVTNEKLIFRPTSSTTARSWRWAAIQRIDVLDPPRGSSNRVLKLKANSDRHSAVAITVPGHVFHSLVKDLNARLSAFEQDAEGPVDLPPNPPRETRQCRRHSGGTRQSGSENAAVSKPSHQRKLSMPQQQSFPANSARPAVTREMTRPETAQEIIEKFTKVKEQRDGRKDKKRNSSNETAEEKRNATTKTTGSGFKNSNSGGGAENSQATPPVKSPFPRQSGEYTPKRENPTEQTPPVKTDLRRPPGEATARTGSPVVKTPLRRPSGGEDMPKKLANNTQETPAVKNPSLRSSSAEETPKKEEAALLRPSTEATLKKEKAPLRRSSKEETPNKEKAPLRSPSKKEKALLRRTSKEDTPKKEKPRRSSLPSMIGLVKSNSKDGDEEKKDRTNKSTKAEEVRTSRRSSLPTLYGFSRSKGEDDKEVDKEENKPEKGEKRHRTSLTLSSPLVNLKPNFSLTKTSNHTKGSDYSDDNKSKETTGSSSSIKNLRRMPLLGFLKPPPERKIIAFDNLGFPERQVSAQQKSEQQSKEEPRKPLMEVFREMEQRSKQQNHQQQRIHHHDHKQSKKADDIDVTPTQQPKKKVLRGKATNTQVDDVKRQQQQQQEQEKARLNISRDKDRDIVFTPPTQHKEKLPHPHLFPALNIDEEIVFTPTQEQKPKVDLEASQEIEWTPPRDEPKQRASLLDVNKTIHFGQDNDTDGEELSSEEADDHDDDDSSTSSSLDAVPLMTPPSGRKPAVRAQEQTVPHSAPTQRKPPARTNARAEPLSERRKSSKKLVFHGEDDDDEELDEEFPMINPIWSPKAPENRFRLMLYKHAAACQCKKGCCEYDPECTELKTILNHMDTCSNPQCDFEGCVRAKQFLLTMRLMMQQPDEVKRGVHNEFLSSVGAIAPIPVVQIPFGDDDDGDDNASTGSDWSNISDLGSWGGVEDGEEIDFMSS
jgi:hypothetical protein